VIPAGFPFWTFLAGLGLFLFAMAEMEAGLTDLAGGSMRSLLRRGTRTTMHGIVFGAFVTAVLQSSTVVLLMVLAFVGAGVLTPVHALGVVLGANLGTTVTGWIVATLGFKLEIELFALPLVGVGALAMVFLRKGTRVRDAGRAALALGLLLLGLSYMKGSVESLASVIDPVRLAAYPTIVFALVGALFTALIHSSSAMVMIALSALSAGLIDIELAAAVVVGADLGTTSTALLGAAGGGAEKKRVAVAHFLINVITAAVAFPLISPLLALVRALGISDPLYALVAFHSSFNALGILIFLPFLGPFWRILESRIRETREGVARFITQVPPNVPDSALEALELETTHLLSRAMRHNLAVFDAEVGFEPPVQVAVPERSILASRSALDEYAALKHLGGEILDYVTELQRQSLRQEAAVRATSEIEAVRHALRSAKNIKDIRHNVIAYRGDEPERAGTIRELGANLSARYQELAELWRVNEPSVRFEKLAGLLAENRSRYESGSRSTYQRLAEDRLEPEDVSTELNINREVYSSTKGLLEATAWHLLDAQAAEHLEALPAVNNTTVNA
jgi:phosphate:Na+ symporter